VASSVPAARYDGTKFHTPTTAFMCPNGMVSKGLHPPNSHTPKATRSTTTINVMVR
jgi:hypothetical protein